MLYTSILEGWSRGALRRADARALLGVACREAASRLGERAGASIGAVGPGAFGNEPTYRGVAELADDVAVARAAGVDDLALFDLGGVILRGPPEPWLDAFVATGPSRACPIRRCACGPRSPALASREACSGRWGGSGAADPRRSDLLSERRAT